LEEYFLARTSEQEKVIHDLSPDRHYVEYVREAVRDRVLYNLILFVLLLVASAPLFGQISIGMERLILVNVGLSSISLFGVIIAILSA